jgi:hypothetical protein
MALRAFYTLFIGILIALFVGLGISTFYERPKPPEYKETPYARTLPVDYEKDGTTSAQMQKEQAAYDKKWQEYTKKNEVYNRDVSIIALVSSIIILVISLTLVQNLLLISDGLLLGGVFTLIYSLFRSFETRDSKFEFIVVSIGLAIALALGYKKFIKSTSKPKKKK